MFCGVNAIGNNIPNLLLLLLVYPRVNFQPFMIHVAPSGTVGATQTSGWSNVKVFVEFLDLFVSHVEHSQERPLLLLFDNHDSYVKISAINLAKNSGIVLLICHPKTSQKIQKLDRTVLRPITTRL